MRTWAITAFCAGTTLASWALTRTFRNYAQARGMLDVPNERSSHVRPTPRGGGAAIVLVTLAALCVLSLTNVLNWRPVLGFGAAGGVVAIAGFVDDRRHLKRRWRLLSHCGGASILWLSMSPSPSIAIHDSVLSGAAAFPLVILYVIWLINLTNFMDGVDGLAASEAVSVALGGAVLYAMTTRPDASIVGTAGSKRRMLARSGSQVRDVSRRFGPGSDGVSYRITGNRTPQVCRACNDG